MNKLDEIRAEIVARLDTAKRCIDRDQRVLDCMVASLEAHDRAVAAMPTFRGDAIEFNEVKLPRAPRRDINAAVRGALTGMGQTPAQIGAAINVKPSRVRAALESFTEDVVICDDGYLWRRP